MDEKVDFGKYKGQPVSVLLNDPDYCRWLINQPSFARNRKYGLVMDMIEGRSQTTPQHNTLQLKFLDIEFRLNFIERFLVQSPNPIDKQTPKKRRRVAIPVGESLGNIRAIHPSSGIEVIEFKFEQFADVYLKCRLSYIDVRSIYVEIKPQVGDDFPDVLRQIQRQKKAWESSVARRDLHGKTYWILLIDKFESSTINRNQLCEYFRTQDISVIFFDEINVHKVIVIT